MPNSEFILEGRELGMCSADIGEKSTRSRMNKNVRIIVTIGFAVLALVLVRQAGRAALLKVAKTVGDDQYEPRSR